MKNDSFIIQGLAGKKTLNGTVSINGAKNAVLKAMAACVLFSDTVKILNVPQTEDVKKMIKLFEIFIILIFYICQLFHHRL